MLWIACLILQIPSSFNSSHHLSSLSLQSALDKFGSDTTWTLQKEVFTTADI